MGTNQSGADIYCFPPNFALRWNAIVAREEGTPRPKISGKSVGEIRCNPGIYDVS